MLLLKQRNYVKMVVFSFLIFFNLLGEILCPKINFSILLKKGGELGVRLGCAPLPGHKPPRVAPHCRLPGRAVRWGGSPFIVPKMGDAPEIPESSFYVQWMFLSGK